MAQSFVGDFDCQCLLLNSLCMTPDAGILCRCPLCGILLTPIGNWANSPYTRKYLTLMCIVVQALHCLQMALWQLSTASHMHLGYTMSRLTAWCKHCRLKHHLARHHHRLLLPMMALPSLAEDEERLVFGIQSVAMSCKF